MAAEDALYNYSIQNCAVVEDDVFAFFATIDPTRDGTTGYEHLSPCRIVHYDVSEDRWQWRDIARTGSRKIAVGRAADGSRETVFLNSLNEVVTFRYNDGRDKLETTIPRKAILVASAIRFVGKHFLVAGTDYGIVRRDGPEQWTSLYSKTDGQRVDLEVLDGFAEDDLYLAGTDDDFSVQAMFHFDGKAMTQQVVPAHFQDVGFQPAAVSCTPNGNVYVLDRGGGLITGNNSEGWRTVIQPRDAATDAMFDMVWYKDTLYATTIHCLYCLHGNRWVPVNPGNKSRPVAFGFVDANETTLLAAGPYCASIFDGSEWKSIYS